MNSLTRQFFAPLLTVFLFTAGLVGAEPAAPLRIMPLGDSNTKGPYLVFYTNGSYAGEPIGLPNPLGGGWRKPLQDKLRAAGVAFDFVGELDYHAYGSNGVVDALFDPHHHGLSGFGNREILNGGGVPVPPDVLQAKGVKGIAVPGILSVLQKHQPNVILLMAGSNGFSPAWRARLIRAIAANSTATLFVATIPPQRAPRDGWEQVESYNRFFPVIVAEQQAAGRPVHLVDIYSALSADDLMPDGVHLNSTGLMKTAEAWFTALELAGLAGKPVDAAQRAEGVKKTRELADALIRAHYAKPIEDARATAEAETGIDASKADLFKSPADFVGGDLFEYDLKCPLRFASCIGGKLSANATLTTGFACDPFPPAGAYELILSAQDDDAEKPCGIRIAVNGKAVFEGPSPFVRHGWSRHSFAIPLGLLKRDNVLTIECTEAGSIAQRGPPWFMVNYAVIKKVVQ